MKTQNENVNSSKESSIKSKERKNYNKWDPVSTIIAGLLFLNLLIIIIWFFIDSSIFTTAENVLPKVWSAVALLISVFGIVSSKTTLLRLLRLPPIRLVVVLFTITTVIVSLIVLPIHSLKITASYNGLANDEIVIEWEGEIAGPTKEGSFVKSYLKVKKYTFKARYGPISSEPHTVEIGLLPFKQEYPTIQIKSTRESEYGSLFIKTKRGNDYVKGSTIFIDDNIQSVNTPGKIEDLRVGNYLIKATITINGTIYSGEIQNVPVLPSITDTIDIMLTPQDSLPAEVEVKAIYNGTEYPATIILDGDTLNRVTPYTIRNLKRDEVDIKVYYISNNIYYEGERRNIILQPGHNEPVIIELRQIR